MDQSEKAFWSIGAEDLLRRLDSSEQGLSDREASQRLSRMGPNLVKPRVQYNTFILFFNQFKSPIILILLFATLLAFFLGDRIDAVIILSIVVISGLLGFWQERSAADAVKKLLAIVQIRAAVWRNGAEKEIPVEEIVPGDIVVLNAGDIIPGDCLILQSRDLFVDEATLTGETYPVAKEKGMLPRDTAFNQRTNVVYMGTHVSSGTANAAVVHTGAETEFGRVSERLKLRPAETEFERGIRRFGFLLLEVTLLLVIAIFAINVFFARPILDAFLFSLALAVGLTPQLLPAIISINLAHGARTMAQHKVIVKRLASIENFGSMNVLCSDKTGTLTEGEVRLKAAVDWRSKASERVFLYGYLNSHYETGFTNPIDAAIRGYGRPDISGYRKLDELPYDFNRKRLTVLVESEGESIMVTKGALDNILDVCESAETSQGEILDIGEVKSEIEKRFEEISADGLRTLGIAYRRIGHTSKINRDDESVMTFLGFLVFDDPLKPDIADTIGKLKRIGVDLKIITGDNHLVAASIGRQIGGTDLSILTGRDFDRMSDEALTRKVNRVDIFSEVDPNQKERIIIALKKAGNVVGYIGDGINDASALHAADVGISVDSAVDVAKEAADIVLLEKDLRVLENGVREGRKTFSNTLKYVFMATSANFGNMFSMAGASLFLPYLPLLPKQIMLTNLLTDFPEMTIATDNVDHEMVEKPRRWDIKFIRNFMITFGLISSIFDFATFGVLLLLLGASPEQFRSGWFMESVISASVIVLIIRTRRFFLKSRPGRYLVITTALVAILVLIFPLTWWGKLFGFAPLPPLFLLLLGVIVLIYVGVAEAAKAIFYKKIRNA
ncbi:MAG: magnesium-translocating P-type ATPase [Dehalococcoidia bacterium]|nr:magnesium-translocating P-type ATPase [Dehalococcoidia bacterium]